MFEWFLKWFSKERLFRIAKLAVRRIFGRLYDEVEDLVIRAEFNKELPTGYDKGKWVVSEMIKKHNELKEWEFVINIIKELVHAEFNKKLQLPDVFGWIKRVF
jgi:hypothetical protein